MMEEIDLAAASPNDCLQALDEVMAELSQLDDPVTLGVIEHEVRRAAILSGRAALLEVANRGDKTEMLAALQGLITDNIVRKAFEVPIDFTS